MKRLAGALAALMLALLASPAFAQTTDDARAEAIRSRAFIRAAETQLTKVILALDSLPGGVRVDTVVVTDTLIRTVVQVDSVPVEVVRWDTVTLVRVDTVFVAGPPDPVDHGFSAVITGQRLTWTESAGATAYRITFQPTTGPTQSQDVPAATRGIDIPAGSPAGEICVTSLRGTATITAPICVEWAPAVTPPPPAPPPPPTGDGSAFLVEEFDYASRTEMLADPRGIYDPPETINPGMIALRTVDGDQAMCYDYPPRRQELTVSRSIRIPSGTRRLWVEAWIWFSPGFVVDQPNGAASGLKLLHFGAAGDSRYAMDLEHGTGGYTSIYLPNDVPFEANHRPLWDTRDLISPGWHRVRRWVDIDRDVHGAQLDEGRRYEYPNLSNRTMWTVSLARNFNWTPAAAQSLCWGRVAIYTQDPGW